MSQKNFENVWTAEEDHTILSNPELKVRELVEMLPNRSFEAIKKRRQKLRKDGQLDITKATEMQLDLPPSIPVITDATDYKPVIGEGDIHEWKGVTDDSLAVDPELEEILEDANTKIDLNLDEIAQRAIEAFEEARNRVEPTEEETPQKINVPIKSVRERQK